MAIRFTADYPTLSYDLRADGDYNLIFPRFVQLLDLLNLMRQTVPLTSFECKYQTANTRWLYRFSLEDGRTWTQFIDVSGAEPTMTFSTIAGAWKLSEFAPHREIRDLCIELAVLGMSSADVVYS